MRLFLRRGKGDIPQKAVRGTHGRLRIHPTMSSAHRFLWDISLTATQLKSHSMRQASCVTLPSLHSPGQGSPTLWGSSLKRFSPELMRGSSYSTPTAIFETLVGRRQR